MIDERIAGAGNDFTCTGLKKPARARRTIGVYGVDAMRLEDARRLAGRCRTGCNLAYKMKVIFPALPRRARVGILGVADPDLGKSGRGAGRL